MSTDLDLSMSKILKLGDAGAELMKPNHVQRINGNDADNFKIYSRCSNHQVDEAQESIVLPTITESCTECFQELHSHIKRVFEPPGYLGGYKRAFETLFSQDVGAFKVSMTLYLDRL